MRIDTEQRTFETNIVAAPSTFQIQATAKAFQILSNQLYTNKALAIVRELTCNAIDAHVAAGCTDIPFRVHIPTVLEPWFEIEDFGTGLSDTAIRQLYCTYFASNKTGTDELIGGFGLGSKSPFAYTDQFTVTSRYHGMKRKYSIFIAADGTPQIMEVECISTAELNGLTVHLGVAMKDTTDFRMAANSVLPFVTSCAFEANVEVRRPEYTVRVDLVDGAYYQVRADAATDSSIRVVQGSVCYNTSDTDCPELQAWLPGTDIYVPIGTLDVAVSRENISYSERTREWFKRVGADVRAKVKQQIIDDLAQRTTVIERTKYLFNITGYSHPLAKYVNDDMYDPIHSPSGCEAYSVSVGWSRRSKHGSCTLNSLVPDTNAVSSVVHKLYTKTIVKHASKNVYWAEKKTWVKPFVRDLYLSGKREDEIDGLVMVGPRHGCFAFLAQLGADANVVTVPKPPKKLRSNAASYTGMYFCAAPGDSMQRVDLPSIIEDDNVEKIVLIDKDTYNNHELAKTADYLIQANIPIDTSVQFVHIPESHRRVRSTLLKEDFVEEMGPHTLDISVRRRFLEILDVSKDTVRDRLVQDARSEIAQEALSPFRFETYERTPQLTVLQSMAPDIYAFRSKAQRIWKTLLSDSHTRAHISNYVAKTLFTEQELKAIQAEAKKNPLPEVIEVNALITKYGPWVRHLHVAFSWHAAEAHATLLAGLFQQHRTIELIMKENSPCTPISSPETPSLSTQAEAA